MEEAWGEGGGGGLAVLLLLPPLVGPTNRPARNPQRWAESEGMSCRLVCRGKGAGAVL